MTLAQCYLDVLHDHVQQLQWLLLLHRARAKMAAAGRVQHVSVGDARCVLSARESMQHMQYSGRVADEPVPTRARAVTCSVAVTAERGKRQRDVRATPCMARLKHSADHSAARRSGHAARSAATGVPGGHARLRSSSCLRIPIDLLGRHFLV